MIARRIALLVTFFALTFSAQALPIVLTSNGGQTVTGVQNFSLTEFFTMSKSSRWACFNQAFGGDIPYFAVNGGAVAIHTRPRFDAELVEYNSPPASELS
jgi:hypothetical protein